MDILTKLLVSCSLDALPSGNLIVDQKEQQIKIIAL